MIISVIIPTYKPADYLWTCLDSLNYQTFGKDDFEIIIVLNGCNEPFYSQIYNYVVKNLSDCNVNLIQTDKRGVSNARNIALNKAKGDYITFIDDDDYVSEQYLKRLYEAATDGHLSVSKLSSFQDGSNKPMPSSIEDNYYRIKDLDSCSIEQARSYFSGPVGKLYRRDIIGNRRFNPSFSVGEDTLFNFLISDKIKSVKATQEDAVYHRRVRNSSASFKKKSIYSLLYNMVKALYNYTIIMVLHPFSYNIKFYISRCGGTILGVYTSFKLRNAINSKNHL